MADYYVSTFSPKGWSQKALDYLLYLAEHPLANSHEICDAIGISYRLGKTAYIYRKKYNGWRECEAELRDSLEACNIFIARINQPSLTKKMVEQAKGGKASVAAANYLRDMLKPKEEPVVKQDWMAGLLSQPSVDAEVRELA